MLAAAVDINTIELSFRSSPAARVTEKDVFKFVEEGKGNIVEKFDEAIKTVASLHNLSVKQIEDYFDKEVIEKLGEK